MSLEKIRQEIDMLDTQMKELFLNRMELSRQVIEEKMRTGGSIYAPEREAAMMKSRMEGVQEEKAPEYGMFLKQVIAISRTYQYSHLDWPKPLEELSGYKGEMNLQFVCPVKAEHLLAAVMSFKMAGIHILQMQTEKVSEENILCRMKIMGDFGLSLAKGAILQVYEENEEVLLQKTNDGKA